MKRAMVSAVIVLLIVLAVGIAFTWMPRCVVCGARATVHIHESYFGAPAVSRHFCETHGAPALKKLREGE